MKSSFSCINTAQFPEGVEPPLIVRRLKEERKGKNPTGVSFLSLSSSSFMAVPWPFPGPSYGCHFSFHPTTYTACRQRNNLRLPNAPKKDVLQKIVWRWEEIRYKKIHVSWTLISLVNLEGFYGDKKVTSVPRLFYRLPTFEATSYVTSLDSLFPGHQTLRQDDIKGVQSSYFKNQKPLPRIHTETEPLLREF